MYESVFYIKYDDDLLWVQLCDKTTHEDHRENDDFKHNVNVGGLSQRITRQLTIGVIELAIVRVINRELCVDCRDRRADCRMRLQ